MIRIFNHYVPSRSLGLLAGEITMVFLSFGFAILLSFGSQAGLILFDHLVFFRFFLVAFVGFLCAHYFELYDLGRLSRTHDAYPRILLIIGILALLSAVLERFFPEFLMGRNVFPLGFFLLAITLLFWRWMFLRLILVPFFRERVFLIGSGQRAGRIFDLILSRAELGMDVVGWMREESEPAPLEARAAALRKLVNERSVTRIIVAMKDRRTGMPVEELLALKLHGIRVDDGTSLLEKMSGKLEVDELHPSWMIFGDGFRFGGQYRYALRFVSLLLALFLTLLTLPVLPVIYLLIKLTSRGPVLYKQKRVGLGQRVFDCYKFRTMRQDAEADTGPTWASDEDPRITRVGHFLRRTRLDEIPQLWNVLKGDMGFVGPRPERPEFTEKLSRQIPYYNLRHFVRPGLTGWAQVNYGYGSTVDEAKEKLRYDLYYVRNVSVMLDLLIVFYTIRAVIIGRGVR